MNVHGPTIEAVTEFMWGVDTFRVAAWETAQGRGTVIILAECWHAGDDCPYAAYSPDVEDVVRLPKVPLRLLSPRVLQALGKDHLDRALPSGVQSDRPVEMIHPRWVKS